MQVPDVNSCCEIEQMSLALYINLKKDKAQVFCICIMQSAAQTERTVYDRGWGGDVGGNGNGGGG